MKKIVIIGAGAMGTAFAVPCIENKNDVTIVGTHLENELIDNINSNNKIHPALKTKLSTEIKFKKFEKLQTILEQDLDIVVCGVSSVGIEWFVNQISKSYNNTISIVLLTKGLSILDKNFQHFLIKLKIF